MEAEDPSSARYVDERDKSTSGAPLTRQRTTALPDSSFTSWKVAMNLYAASKGTSATRG